MDYGEHLPKILFKQILIFGHLALVIYCIYIKKITALIKTRKSTCITPSERLEEAILRGPVTNQMLLRDEGKGSSRVCSPQEDGRGNKKSWKNKEEQINQQRNGRDSKYIEQFVSCQPSLKRRLAKEPGGLLWPVWPTSPSMIFQPHASLLLLLQNNMRTILWKAMRGALRSRERLWWENLPSPLCGAEASAPSRSPWDHPSLGLRYPSSTWRTSSSSTWHGSPYH